MSARARHHMRAAQIQLVQLLQPLLVGPAQRQVQQRGDGQLWATRRRHAADPHIGLRLAFRTLDGGLIGLPALQARAEVLLARTRSRNSCRWHECTM